MNDELVKRKREIEEEFDEILEMDNDLVNAKSNITIAVIGKLLQKFNEYLIDMAEIASKNKYYDENLTSALQETVSKLLTAFSQIQPPTINVTPNVKFDLQLLQPVLNKIGDQNSTLINLVSKYNNNQNEALLKLITSVVDRQIEYLDKEIKQLDYTNNFKGIENAINNRPTEFKSKVTQYNNQGRIEEITTKIIK